jgi:tetratricopeptide (TPR) repeat protein
MNPRTLLALGAALLIAATSAAAAEPPDPVRYESCMNLARSDPQKGLEAGIAWRKSGGGAVADHCVATALVARGDAAEGAKLLEELAAEEDNPATRAKLFGQAGRAWLADGDNRRAWGALDDGLRLDPQSTDMLIDRAIANAGLGLTFEAIDDLDRALDLAPGRADALVLRGTAWRRMNSLDLAEDDIGRALAIAPQNVDALLERGNLRRLRGKAAEARADFLAVMRLDPNGPAGEAARRSVEAMDSGKQK